MKYSEFRKYFASFGCFFVNQVLAAMPNFDCKKLEHWRRRQQIIKLRQNFYALGECAMLPNYKLYLSNCIHQPSYISFRCALVFHGMRSDKIYNENTEITAISTIKTTAFRNDIGVFAYKKIEPKLMFGYEQHPFSNPGSRSISIAKPEKALLDIFHIHRPNTQQDIKKLQIDKSFVRNKINPNNLLQMAKLYHSKALLSRIDLFRSIYGI
ncbi:MAG: hypothetical protein LBR45_01065 [Bacteroidales bacterium]|jgi:hypothetical protein|nr:hypothetical protein [Bacteroidales bacterium]